MVLPSVADRHLIVVYWQWSWVSRWHGRIAPIFGSSHEFALDAVADSMLLFERDTTAPLLAQLHGVLGREKFAKHLQARGLTATQIFEGYAALATVVGAEDQWRIRARQCRIIYEILDDQLIVTVVKIGDQRNCTLFTIA